MFQQFIFKILNYYVKSNSLHFFKDEFNDSKHEPTLKKRLGNTRLCVVSSLSFESQLIESTTIMEGRATTPCARIAMSEVRAKKK